MSKYTEIICVSYEVTSHLLGQVESSSDANLKQRLHSQDMLLSLNVHAASICSAVLTQQVFLCVPCDCAEQQCLAIEDNSDMQLLSAGLAD